MTFRKAAFSLAVLLLASAPLALAQGTYTQIDYPGATSSFCLGVDSAGDVVGYYNANGTGKDYGFILSGGNYATVIYRGNSTVLYGINDQGQIVGTSITGFVYDIQMQTFTKIAYPGSHGTHGTTYADSINNAGTVAGSFFYQARWRGFELVGATYSPIMLGGANTYINGISSSGTLAGFAKSKTTGEYLNFLYTQGQYKSLAIPNAPGAQVYGIAPSGNAVVGFYNPTAGVTTAFVYQNGILTTLQFPGSNLTYAYGVNDSGEVVGTFLGSDGADHGFTWTPPAAESDKK